MYTNELKNCKHLEEKELEELLRIYRTDVNQQQLVKDKIFKAFVRLIQKEAKRFKDCNYQRISFEDLIQEGTIGLLEAVDRYIPGKDSNFTSYAKKYICGYIKNVTTKRLKTNQLVSCSMQDEFVGSTDSSTSGKTVGEIIADTYYTNDMHYIENRSDIEYFDSLVVTELTEKERNIIHDRFSENMTLEKIGEKYFYTAPAINIIIKNALNKIRDAFNEEQENTNFYCSNKK